MAQQLRKLIEDEGVLEVEGALEKRIQGLTQDSRRVENDSLFVAIKGLKADGHSHIEEAVNNGAVAVVYEEKTCDDFHRDPRTTYIRVADSRRTLAHLAAAYYGHPSARMTLIGITGTNGKTTTSHILGAMLETESCRVGYIGTLGYRLGNRTVSTGLTTPEAPELQRILWEMVESGISYVVMEVSSHALELDRIEGCRFKTGVFTNLTRDHLDFHGTMEDYFASKRRLFRDFGVETAVVNRDDPWSVPLLDGIQTPTLTYSLEGRADIYARDIHLSQKGISLVACTSQEKIPLESPLMGRYNIYNILAAMGTACSLGVGQDGIREGTRALKGVPGRFERVETDQGFLVIVDYAHTEDALERILRTAKELNPACLITVFGCGGDRDKSKRPRMGQVATAYSDYTFITSDNPRGENPKTILQEIVEGARGLTSDIQEQRDKGSGARTPSPEPFEVIVDRREAIHRAVLKAKTGDIVVIAGKGHETYQILGNRTIHFDDREVAREAIQLGMKKERKPRWKD